MKNRIFRSNISGRFDNYDGSGNQARINWEVKFASGRRRRDHLLVRARCTSRGRIMPNYATIDDDDAHPVLAGSSGKAVHEHDCKYILQLEPRRPAA